MVALGMFEDERIELLRGVLVPMSPIGPRHSSTIDKLTRLLVVALLDRAIVRVQNPFAATDDSEPQPDICVVPLGDYEDFHPERAEILIEVAESSLRRDRGLKLGIYAENGVPEYWIVDVVGRVIEVHSEPSATRYGRMTRFERGQVIRPARFPDVELRVDEIVPK
jgi:Uma2 family endonuclease